MALQRQLIENAFGHPVQRVEAGVEKASFPANAAVLPVQRQDETQAELPTSARNVAEARSMAEAAAVELDTLLEEARELNDPNLSASESEARLDQLKARLAEAKERMHAAKLIRDSVVGELGEGQADDALSLELAEIEEIHLQFSAHVALLDELLLEGPAPEAPERISTKGWVRLAIEATGHFLQATVQTVGGLIAAIGTGGAALLPGVVSAVGGVGQAIIGICKSIRSHFIRMRKAVAKKTAMNRLIAFEGVVATATAIAGLVAGALSPDFWRALVTGLLKAVDVVGGVVKTLRGVFADYLSNRAKGIMIMVESGLGFLSGLGSSIGAGIVKGASWIFNVVAQVLKQIVSIFKGARGYAKASE